MMLNLNQYPSEEDGWVKLLQESKEAKAEEKPKVTVKQRRSRRAVTAPAAEVPAAKAPEQTLHIAKEGLPWEESVAQAESKEESAATPAIPIVAPIVGQAGTYCYLGGEVHMVVLNDPEIKVFRKVNR